MIEALVAAFGSPETTWLKNIGRVKYGPTVGGAVVTSAVAVAVGSVSDVAVGSEALSTSDTHAPPLSKIPIQGANRIRTPCPPRTGPAIGRGPRRVTWP